MVKGFNFEKGLPHQDAAVKSIVDVFDNFRVTKSTLEYQNNLINLDKESLFNTSITHVQNDNNIKNNVSNEYIFDIQMETGTGKTYTYTKTMLELNKRYGIFKFVIVVPTLSIKAGTVNFLKSDSLKNHFRSDYGKNINTYVVDSKESKQKKDIFPNSISSFIRGTNFGNNIHVLVINSGMITTGKSLYRTYDTSMLDQYSVPLDGIKACKPIMIIDEPHKFKKDNKTFKEIKKFESQFIIRYGATFDDEYYNLLYKLNAVDSFNQDLVKGITVHIDEFEAGKNEYIELVKNTGKEATFKITHGKGQKKITLIKNDSLELLHNEIKNVTIENMNIKKVVLSNGLELTKGTKINPFSYSNTLQQRMLEKAIKNHFILEKDYLMREVKIKPLSLFFIDDIASYRDNGAMAIKFEQLVKNEIQSILKDLESKGNLEKYEEFYVEYLKESLNDIAGTHGGYFSVDNKSSDEKIEQEINEIIHDKEKLIDYENIRRFIFSKWTLKEGWDNPNVFQIVKLRTSGSETSKLQEVGRGLRIPVNQYMERVKDEQFELHYFVDFTEKDFVKSLTNEINSQVTGNTIIEYNAPLQQLIKTTYPELEKAMVMHATLNAKGIINDDLEFVDGGYEKLLEAYPLIRPSKMKNGKVKHAKDETKMVSIRTENYALLKDLWEKINQKVILEYDFKNEEEVKIIFTKAISECFGITSNISSITSTLNRTTGKFEEKINLDDIGVNVATINYGEFLNLVAKNCGLNIQTIHETFIELKLNNDIDINGYLNLEAVSKIKQAFDDYLIANVDVEFKIKYNNITNKIHPTKLTDKYGNPLSNIKASDVGVNFDNNIKVSDKYLYDVAYWDSDIEKDNIDTKKTPEISQVIVYAKIPKGSVRIPIVGGYSYSPDFAYVIEYENGEKELNLIIESKGKTKVDLSINEEKRIKHAELLYSNTDYNVVFKRQMSNKNISDIINEVVNGQE